MKPTITDKDIWETMDYIDASNPITIDINYETINTNIMKQEVKVTSVTQTANPILGKEEQTLYYVIIGEGDDKVIIGIGEKNHDKLKILLDPNNKGTKLTVDNGKK